MLNDLFATIASKNNLVDKLREFERRVRALELRETKVGKIDEISADLGEFQTGNAGGWELDTGTLSSANGEIVLDAANEQVRVGAGVAGFLDGAGFFAGMDEALAKMHVGDPAGDYMAWDGANLEVAGKITAETGDIGGWAIGATKLTGGGVELDSAGQVTVGSGSSTAAVSGMDALYRFWAGAAAGASAPFRVSKAGDVVADNITARGSIITNVLVKNGVQATGGTMILAKSAGKVLASCTSVSSPATFTMDIEDPESGHAQLFTVNDVLRVGDGVNTNWVTVSAVSDETTFYRYTVVKQSGSEVTFGAGSMVLDYGVSGNGFLELSADQSNAPWYSVKSHSGSPWSGSSISEIARLGNLKGFLGEASERYGLMMANGEIRLGTGTPGSDFTGTRMVYPSQTTELLAWNLATFNSDKLQVALNTAGELIAAGGAIKLNSAGESITGVNRTKRQTWTSTNDYRSEQGTVDGGSGYGLSLLQKTDAGTERVVTPSSSSDFEDGASTVAKWGYGISTGSKALTVNASTSKLDGTVNAAWLMTMSTNLCSTTLKPLVFIGSLTFTFATAGTLAIKAYYTDGSYFTTRYDVLSSESFAAGTFPKSFDLVIPQYVNASYAYISIEMSGADPGGSVVQSLTVTNSSVSIKEYAGAYRNIYLSANGVESDQGMWPEQFWAGFGCVQMMASNRARLAPTIYFVGAVQALGVIAYRSGTAANGDIYEYYVPLAKGTYSFDFYYQKASNAGKVDLYVDDVKVNGSTLDMYAAATTTNQEWIVTSIVLSYHGVHKFKLRVNSKHASSSGYYVIGYFVSIYRTG